MKQCTGGSTLNTMTSQPSNSAKHIAQNSERSSSLTRFVWPGIGVLALIGVVILTVSVHAHSILAIDRAGYGFISAHIISDSLTPVIRVVTKAASAATLITIAAVMLVVTSLRHRPRVGIAVALNLAFIAGINEIFKMIMQRPRPNVPRLAVENGYSFPSGHAMASTAFYGFLIYLTYRYVHNRAAKWVIIVLLVLLVPTIMFTRVYLGVHYVSDVLAGCLCSIAWLTLIWVPVMKRTLLK